MMLTPRLPFHEGECECGRPPGECVKGDLDRCDADEIEDDEEPLYDEWEDSDDWL